MALEDKATRRARRLEALDIRVDETGNYFATTEDGKEHALIVDPTYQRGLDQRKVDSIRDDWDPIAADPITLSLRRSGDLAIVNGQHEMVAAILEGESEILAEVFTGLTVAREADIRLKKNNQRADTALEKFHARLTKEKEAPGRATAIVALLGDFGTYVNKTPNKYAGINCVGTLERIYRRQPPGAAPGTEGDGVILRWTFRVLKEAFGEIQGEVAQSALIEGLSWFLTVHQGEYGRKKLLDQIRKYGTAEINDVARGFKRAMGGADWINAYRSIVEAYNRAIRKTENKLEFKTQRWSAEAGGWGAERKAA